MQKKDEYVSSTGTKKHKKLKSFCAFFSALLKTNKMNLGSLLHELDTQTIVAAFQRKHPDLAAVLLDVTEVVDFFRTMPGAATDSNVAPEGETCVIHVTPTRAFYTRGGDQKRLALSGVRWNQIHHWPIRVQPDEENSSIVKLLAEEIVVHILAEVTCYQPSHCFAEDGDHSLPCSSSSHNQVSG